MHSEPLEQAYAVWARGELSRQVDRFLEDGISEDKVDHWVQTASILHSNGDGYDVTVKDGRIVGRSVFVTSAKGGL